MRDEEIPHRTHTNFQARELRAIASYLSFHPNYSLKQVIYMATWRNNISLFLLLWDIPLAGDGTRNPPKTTEKNTQSDYRRPRAHNPDPVCDLATRQSHQLPKNLWSNHEIWDDCIMIYDFCGCDNESIMTNHGTHQPLWLAPATLVFTLVCLQLPIMTNTTCLYEATSHYPLSHDGLFLKHMDLTSGILEKIYF